MNMVVTGLIKPDTMLMAGKKHAFIMMSVVLHKVPKNHLQGFLIGWEAISSWCAGSWSQELLACKL